MAEALLSIAPPPYSTRWKLVEWPVGADIRRAIRSANGGVVGPSNARWMSRWLTNYAQG